MAPRVCARSLPVPGGPSPTAVPESTHSAWCSSSHWQSELEIAKGNLKALALKALASGASCRGPQTDGHPGH
jgi:hypothetical protein